MIRFIAATLTALSLSATLLLPRDALACSGGGAGSGVASPTGWTWLKPSLEPSPPVTPVPIATDGFFVIDAEGNGLTAGDAESSLQVVVTDEAGATVPGEIKLLLDQRLGWYFFGWSASTPLPLGARLLARLSAAPIAPGATGQVGGEFPLVVVGEPSSLPAPSPAFGDWFDFYRGQDGETVSCEAATWECPAGRMLDIPQALDSAVAVQVLWHLPAVTGGVALRARLEPSPKTADADLREASDVSFMAEPPPGSAMSLGLAIFPTRAEQYCVTLVVSDLRTGREQRSEVCAPESTQRFTTTDTRLSGCAAPPNEALTEAWCRTVSEQARAASGTDCSVFLSTSETEPESPAGGASGVGGNDATSPSTPPAPPHTSQGCQLVGNSRSPSGSDAGTSSLMGLVLGVGFALARRRRPTAHERGWSGRPNTGPAFSSKARNSLAKCSECVSTAR